MPELDNPIFPAFAQVIESVLAQSGFTPVLCTQTPGGVTEDEYVEMLLDRQVSGIVFVSGLHADTAANHDRYRALIARPLPIVMINGFVAGIAAPFVSCDDREAADLAVAHLVALGHRRIGLITGPDRFVPVQRQGGRLSRRDDRGSPAWPSRAGPTGRAVPVRRRGRRGGRRSAARPGRAPASSAVPT